VERVRADDPDVARARMLRIDDEIILFRNQDGRDLQDESIATPDPVVPGGSAGG
jgi:hypothetical protein